VAGDVHEAEANVAEIEEGEAEINGDAAALLFFEPVGIGARQGLDKRGLAVVNVAGGADDDVLGGICQGMVPRTMMLAKRKAAVKRGCGTGRLRLARGR